MSRIFKKLCVFVLAFLVIFSEQSLSAASISDQEWAGIQASYSEWLPRFKQYAVQNGISQQTVNGALGNSAPIRRIIELDRKQPESVLTFTQYRQRTVKPRIETGRRMMRLYASELAAVKKKYGVAPEYIVALWGMETSYGANTGGFNVPVALATLAAEGRRAEFFGGELMAALRIIDQGDISAEQMQGSWAGAMGQNQFMPSTFLTLAVDGDGDGHRDIWTGKHPADVFASTANKLLSDGWHAGERWGRAAKLPKNFPHHLVSPDVHKTLKEWKALGVTLPGATLPATDMKASLISPGMNKKIGYRGGPVFLVYNNYRTTLKWNNSSYFATAFGLLADALAQKTAP